MGEDGTILIIRQSTVKQFMDCSLKYKFATEGAPRSQSSALSFGTVIHDAVEVMETEGSLDAGLARFDEMWGNLEKYDLAYEYLIPRNDHAGYHRKGHEILNAWWQIIRDSPDVVLGREYQFTVPIGEHTLTGTVDKWGLRRGRDGWVVFVDDYKTGAKAPTRDYLAHDVQFTAYEWATRQIEFWRPLEDGTEKFVKAQTMPRESTWIHLRGPRRIAAGERTDVHFNRLMYAVDQIELSVATGIFVPDLSGASCEYCEFREICGLPSREQEGLAA